MTFSGSLKGLAPAIHRRHRLHDLSRDWPETNCYVDLWIELLAWLGFEPLAGLGFTVEMDFEGDQFTFFKFPHCDLDDLYGVKVAELAIYDNIENHLREQIERDRVVLIETDAFYLPDAQGVAYHIEHSKTTVAVVRIEPQSDRMDYFHNAGFFSVEGADYAGLVMRDRQEETLFPYAEFVKFGGARADRTPDTARRLLRRRFACVPKSNPVKAFARRLERDAPALLLREPLYFHKYAFNTLRQLGANFELLASHLEWLAAPGVPDLSPIVGNCRVISAGAKTLQFQLARMASRKRFIDAAPALAPMADAWEAIMDGIGAALADGL